MDKCERWQFLPVILDYYEEIPIYSSHSKQTCMGILGKVKPRKCTCGGDVTKCNFYPEKRKEGKTLNTAEMFIQANKDSKTYKCKDMRYNKKDGFHVQKAVHGLLEPLIM